MFLPNSQINESHFNIFYCFYLSLLSKTFYLNTVFHSLMQKHFNGRITEIATCFQGVLITECES